MAGCTSASLRSATAAKTKFVLTARTRNRRIKMYWKPDFLLTLNRTAALNVKNFSTSWVLRQWCRQTSGRRPSEKCVVALVLSQSLISAPAACMLFCAFTFAWMHLSVYYLRAESYADDNFINLFLTSVYFHCGIICEQKSWLTDLVFVVEHYCIIPCFSARTVLLYESCCNEWLWYLFQRSRDFFMLCYLV